MTDTFPLGPTKEVSHGGKKTRAVSARVQGADRRACEGRAGSVAREFEPSEQTIRNWVKQADLDEGRRGDGLTTEARKEMQRLKRDVKRLRMERDILKKAAAWFAKESGSIPRRGYAFMKANRARFPLAAMCRVLGLSPSGYYGWLRRQPSARARRDAELKARILAIWIESGGIYGCPQIHAALLAEGERVGRKRVTRLMRELGIEGVTRRRFKTGTTKRDAKARPAPDLVKRDFSAKSPDQLWVADITQVPTWAGWLYLAVVLDAWSRRIVGWAMETRMPAELVGNALTMAITCRQPKGPVVHHSDSGSQGEFKRSSQHLREELRWRHADADERIELYVHRCVHQAVRRWDAASIGRGSGKRSLEVCRARRPLWQRVCPPLSGRAGFANVVAWHPSIFVPSRGAISRSLSEKRSPFFEPVVVACARSPGSWAAHPRRSRENCGETQLHGEATSSIGPRPLNGTPVGERNVQSLRSSLRTAN